MKQLELSQGILCVLDDDTHSWLCHWKWSVTRPSNKKQRYVRRQMYHPTSQKLEFIYLHRVIAGVTKDFFLSFRDGNPLNLQRENLKICDYCKNEVVWDGSRSESLFTGVVWDKYYGLWKAHLKGLTIGHFVAELDAVEAYNAKAKEILKDRAELNNMEAVWQRK